MAQAPVPISGLLSPVSLDFTLADCPLLLHADEPLATATPFLRWQAYPPSQPGGPPRVGIPHARAVKVFLRRCVLDYTHPNANTFSNVDCFTCFFDEAGWNRILNQLLQSGLLAGAPFTVWPAFLLHLEGLVMKQPSQLQLTPADLNLGESFDSPAVPGRPGAAAVTARRGSRPPAPAVPAVPGQPATPGPSDIAFLSLIKMDAMVSPEAISPLGNWCDLICALNAGRTRTSRLSPMANVRTAGMMLRSAVASRLMGTSMGQTPDPLIAVHFPDLFQEIQLPHCLLPTELNEGEIRAELRDAVRSARSDADRRAVEVARIHFSVHRAPVFHGKIAALSRSNAETMQHLERLYHALQHSPNSSSASNATIASKLDLVEGALAPRLAALEEFINAPGATAHSIVEAFDDCQAVFMFKRLNLVLWPTGFRLGEIVHHSSGETMYLTYESLTWCINGAHYAHPTAAQLAALLAGKDYALLAPPRSKPDQWGEIHCPYPVILTFYVEAGNVYFYGGIVSYCSKQIKVVALSSAEAEYAAAAHTTREILFVQNMLTDLKVEISKPTIIFIDNQAAIKIAENLGVTARNKHFEDSIHFFRHQVDHRRVIPVHVSTKLQKADGFTKLLDNSAFKLWKTNVVQFDAR